MSAVNKDMLGFFSLPSFEITRDFFHISEWLYLRQNCRIVGSLIGTLGKAPRQVEFSGLPMLLSPEEIDLLFTQQKIILCRLKNEFSEEYLNKYNIHTEKTYQEQILLFREERVNEITRMGDQIAQGKMQKQKNFSEDVEIIDDNDDEDPEITKAKILKDEIDKIPKLSRHQALLQTFQEHPWINHESGAKECVEEWTYKGNVLKRIVFADLWKEGFYITDGSKFGGDFLVYPGDPIQFHAKYVVICQDAPEQSSEIDLTTRSRLATSTKKTVIFASLKSSNGDEIKYQAVKWAER